MPWLKYWFVYQKYRNILVVFPLQLTSSMKSSLESLILDRKMSLCYLAWWSILNLPCQLSNSFHSSREDPRGSCLSYDENISHSYNITAPVLKNSSLKVFTFVNREPTLEDISGPIIHRFVRVLHYDSFSFPNGFIPHHFFLKWNIYPTVYFSQTTEIETSNSSAWCPNFRKVLETVTSFSANKCTTIQGMRLEQPPVRSWVAPQSPLGKYLWYKVTR